MERSRDVWNAQWFLARSFVTPPRSCVVTCGVLLWIPRSGSACLCRLVGEIDGNTAWPRERKSSRHKPVALVNTKEGM
jgi:hypothetical protein